MRKSNRGYLLIILACFLWGASPTISYIALNEIPLFYFVSLRFLIGSLTLFLIFWKKIKEISLQNLKACIFTAIFLFSGFALGAYGYRYVIPMKAAFLMSFDTVLIPILYAFLFKKKIKNKEIISALIAFIGLFLINFDGLNLELNWGTAILLLAALCYAGQAIAVAKAVTWAEPGAVAAIQLGLAGLFSLIPAVSFEQIPKEVSSSGAILTVVSGIFCAGVAYYLQAKGQKYINPVKTGVLFSTTPLFGMIISGLVLGNTMSLFAVAGSVVIIFAIINIYLDFFGRVGIARGSKNKDSEECDCECNIMQSSQEVESIEPVGISSLKR